jgi:hypothetical protein
MAMSNAEKLKIADRINNSCSNLAESYIECRMLCHEMACCFDNRRRRQQYLRNQDANGKREMQGNLQYTANEAPNIGDIIKDHTSQSWSNMELHSKEDNVVASFTPAAGTIATRPSIATSLVSSKNTTLVTTNTTSTQASFTSTLSTPTTTTTTTTATPITTTSTTVKPELVFDVKCVNYPQDLCRTYAGCAPLYLG